MAEYSPKSPYFKTPIKRFYLDQYVDRPVNPDSGDRLIAVSDKYEHRPDLLAYELYGDTRLWWIFYRRNMNVLKDPIFGFVSGLQIYAPSRDYIMKVVA